MRRAAWIWLGMMLVLIAPLAWAAPAGKVTVAQGVDPTTLDPQDHEETPARNIINNIYDTLLIRDCNVDNGPILKRWMPRAMGRAARVQHRTSHVTITVDEA